MHLPGIPLGGENSKSVLYREPPEELNLGDLNTFRSDLFDSTGSIVIGKSQGQCIAMDISDDEVAYTFEYGFGLYVGSGSSLSSVQVKGQYVESNGTTIDTLAITGGTGRFSGAKGVVIQETIPQNDPDLNYVYRYTVNLMTGFNSNCEQETALT